MSHTEEELRAAGFKPPEEMGSSMNASTMQELEARLHGLSAQMGAHNTKTMIKALRVDIDHSMKSTQALATLLNRGDGARNVALAFTHLEDAKMRLGMALGDLGHKLPEEYRDESPR